MNGLKHLRPHVTATSLAELRASAQSPESLLNGLPEEPVPPAFLTAISELETEFPVNVAFPTKRLVLTDPETDKVYADVGWAGGSIAFTEEENPRSPLNRSVVAAAERRDSPISPSQRRLSNGNLLRRKSAIIYLYVEGLASSIASSSVFLFKIGRRCWTQCWTHCLFPTLTIISISHLND